ncbi:MAG: hypothetical protein JO370_12855, partial [Paucibacter sp.]|nr:hypothetical protein [Roseateles sp.]
MALLLALGIALSPLAASLPRLGLQARVELHLGLKIVGMAVALAISLLTWNTRQGQPTNFVLAGFGYFAIAILGGLELMLLALAPGVTFFDEGPLSIALQLSADGAAAAAFMTAALGPSRPASERAIRLGTVLTAALVLLSLGLELSALQGSPSIARASAGIEMVLAALVLVAAGLFLRRAQRGELAFGLLSRAALFAAIGIAFGTYLPLGDLSKGLFSGAFKALAWLLVYRALFLEGVLEPWH